MDNLIVFMLGSMIGSFLNVCIVRLPKEKSVVFPASHCPKCQKPIEWYDNIPLISWILLLGKCRQCKQKIAFRYWFVELLTACIFLGFYIHFGRIAILPAYLVMMCCFIVATFVDFEHRIIPDEVSVGGMWLGLFFSVLIPQLHLPSENLLLGGFIAGAIVLLCLILEWIYPVFCKHLMTDQEKYDDKPLKVLILLSFIVIFVVNNHLIKGPEFLNSHLHSLACALVGFIIGGGSIYAMGLLGDVIFRKESMGGGDVKLMAMIGAFLGWKLALLTFFIAPFFGGVVGIVEKIRTKDNTIAYGPFLVIGALVSLFWSEQIIHWLVSGGIYHL